MSNLIERIKKRIGETRSLGYGIIDTARNSCIDRIIKIIDEEVAKDLVKDNSKVSPSLDQDGKIFTIKEIEQ